MLSAFLMAREGFGYKFVRFAFTVWIPASFSYSWKNHADCRVPGTDIRNAVRDFGANPVRVSTNQVCERP